MVIDRIHVIYVRYMPSITCTWVSNREVPIATQMQGLPETPVIHRERQLASGGRKVAKGMHLVCVGVGVFV